MCEYKLPNFHFLNKIKYYENILVFSKDISENDIIPFYAFLVLLDLLLLNKF